MGVPIYDDQVVTDTPQAPLRQLSLGISPCPNDTFIFHALIHGLAPREPGFRLSRLVMADVEELNGLAARGELDVVKISLAAIPDAAPHYRLLPCGGALGRGCGPLLVARADRDPDQPFTTLALPGARTTAALLASLAGVPGRRAQLRYDEVMPAVARGEVDAGVVIHEGRFTYADLGLKLVMDFGEWWEKAYGLPLPLGVIAVRRDLEPQAVALVEAAIKASLAHAWENPKDCAAFVAENAQELSPEVTAAHIATFVTPFSMDVGQEGRKAIEALAAEAMRQAGKPMPEGGLFTPSAG
ncbi:1,4-dihydroxy-6-naphthoate synthase [Fundidesulfovibrio agrisoli]|uniref:1,4-dihydroxy-6-naphthoate synthase n=1 Tax=Fundidesulfovibrio agrisoli TaxID=2922717 RepID=UPI001FADD771|nr:1,4-dihydroxy-6-naphthoate synthase [Fundidesulfovibrio agrisoli]